jgi:acetyl esterase/lipase
MTILERTRRLWRLAPLLLSALSTGCSSAQIVNAFVSHDDFRLVADRAYGDQPRQALDIYQPIAAAAPRPVVIFFYGGNWQTGSKAEYLFVGEALASRGFIVVIPDYRLYPAIRYPDFLTDGAAAVSWTLTHIAEFGGDPNDVSLVGHSAGAYIAAMLGLDGRWLGAERTRLRGVAGLAGPYDFLPLTDPTLQVVFGTEADLSRTQPISFADGTGPPLLLMTGRRDATVDPANSTRLARRIRDHGGRAEERYFDQLGHIALIGALAAPLRFLAPVGDALSEFLAPEATEPHATRAGTPRHGLRGLLGNAISRLGCPPLPCSLCAKPALPSVVDRPSPTSPSPSARGTGPA